MIYASRPKSIPRVKYHLKAPVHITLEFEDEKVIASFDDIEAFSYADTASEAIDLLCKVFGCELESHHSDEKRIFQLSESRFEWKFPNERGD
jgi:hypothetical protein